MPRIHIIIVAAGSGTRFGAPLPKQFCRLCGRPVLMHTVDALRRACPEAEMTLVLSASGKKIWEGLCAEAGYESPAVTEGGATRWESVKNALATADDAEVVLIHDGARPFPNADIIEPMLRTISEGASGCVPVTAVTDSLRLIDDCGGSQPFDRSRLRAVQTPQAFRADRLREAYRLPYDPLFTDDASVMQAAGYGDIALTPGSTHNIKITNPEDLAVAEAFLACGCV